MATAEFGPQPLQAYAALEKTGSGQLLDAIDDAIDALETIPATRPSAAGPPATGCGASPSATATRTG
jgi:hypothetical protein